MGNGTPAGELIRSRQKLMVHRVSILSNWMVHCPLFTLQDAETAAQLGFLLMECIWGQISFGVCFSAHAFVGKVTPIATCQRELCVPVSQLGLLELVISYI